MQAAGAENISPDPDGSFPRVALSVPKEIHSEHTAWYSKTKQAWSRPDYGQLPHSNDVDSSIETNSWILWRRVGFFEQVTDGKLVRVMEPRDDPAAGQGISLRIPVGRRWGQSGAAVLNGLEIADRISVIFGRMKAATVGQARQAVFSKEHMKQVVQLGRNSSGDILDEYFIHSHMICKDFYDMNKDSDDRLTVDEVADALVWMKADFEMVRDSMYRKEDGLMEMIRNVRYCEHLNDGVDKIRYFTGKPVALDSVFNYVPCGMMAVIRGECRLCYCRSKDAKIRVQEGLIEREPDESFFVRSGGYVRTPGRQALLFVVCLAALLASVSLSVLSFLQEDESLFKKFEGAGISLGGAVAFIFMLFNTLFKGLDPELLFGDLVRGRKKVVRMSESGLRINRIVCTLTAQEATRLFKSGYTCLMTAATQGDIQQDEKTTTAVGLQKGILMCRRGAISLIQGISGAKVQLFPGGEWNIDWNSRIAEDFSGEVISKDALGGLDGTAVVG